VGLGKIIRLAHIDERGGEALMILTLVVEIIRLAVGVSIIASCTGKINVIQPKTIRPVFTGLMSKEGETHERSRNTARDPRCDDPSISRRDHHTRHSQVTNLKLNLLPR